MDKVQHFEIPADDMQRAREFYEKTFGWKTMEWPMPNGGNPYIGIHTGPMDEKNMWEEPGFINGGMVQRNEKDFPIQNPVITVVVEDIDAALEKVQNAGGSVVVGKKEIEKMGRYAYIKDSEGNVMGIWQDLKRKEE